MVYFIREAKKIAFEFFPLYSALATKELGESFVTDASVHEWGISVFVSHMPMC